MNEQLKEVSEKLFNEYVKSPNLRMHSKEVAIIMKYLAKTLDEDEELWYFTGLLHDLDYDEIKDIKTHGLKTADVLREYNFPDVMINAILRHNENNGNNRQTAFDYYLSAADNISGLIYAYGLMRKGITGMVSSKLKKKMKDKKFAATVNRDCIYDISQFMELSKFMNIAIEAMITIEKEIGFKE